MSDERLREAKRRWKESRSVEDEAQYLLERVRVGSLRRERLELAAHCGHLGAVTATALGKADLLAGLRGGRWDGETRARAAVALASVAMTYRSASDSRPDEGLAVAKGWINCPCESHRRQAELCRHDSDTAGNGEGSPSCHAAWATASALGAITSGEAEWFERALTHAAGALGTADCFFADAQRVLRTDPSIRDRLVESIAIALRDFALSGLS